MGACASTQAAPDTEPAQKASVNGRAAKKPPPPETLGATTLAHTVAQQEPSGTSRAHGAADGGPDHIASATTSGAGDKTAGKSAAAASAAVSNEPKPPSLGPPAPAGGPEPAQPPSVSHATANGTAAASDPAASEKEPAAAAPVDPRATALAAVRIGGAYRSNESGPARPACQTERLQTVADIRDTLQQAHDPAIGE